MDAKYVFKQGFVTFEARIVLGPCSGLHARLLELGTLVLMLTIMTILPSILIDPLHQLLRGALNLK